MGCVSIKVGCPVCGDGRSHVTHTRQRGRDGRLTWRRRACLSCGSTYDTEAEERVVRVAQRGRDDLATCGITPSSRAS